MISSALYFICFAVLLLNADKGIRIMSIFGMIHILLENALYWWFSAHGVYFDLSLYMTLCWLLDIALLFGTACVLSGWKKKLTLSVSVPILFCQIIVMQFPFLLPFALNFVINSSYQTLMEVLILCASFKDNTIKEWVKTATVVSLVVLARFLPMLVH
ncbi:hypothetical protein [Staphylococcus haemolyticus]|uniref:Putative membrane protein n=1 Tax=Cronobacter phage vB_CsaM_GAP31 TaxID=1141135 RepID=K4F9B7_9CAUD|nr:hypothetical protein [Staphylococcus haemolyticus]YP_006987065.1 hypothetical protein GAP31_229 [Cronobacter phage vB_CsaM_GAP31]AFC21410.1 putative membrane protein [Cronobacter phage vB_CsaM_GAP31]MCC3722197.1 hypothetical protein [Staphylococcus haemolyticus]